MELDKVKVVNEAKKYESKRDIRAGFNIMVRGGRLPEYTEDPQTLIV